MSCASPSPTPSPKPGGSASSCGAPSQKAPKRPGASAASCGSPSAPAAPAIPNAPNPPELHACMGLNACKGHDRFGTNTCAGAGYCATAAAHSCHTNNNCRGQGGCGLYGDGEEQYKNPGNNECAWQGSCAVPINAERFSTDGKNQGKSVWKRARALFEERMKKAKRQYGPAPMPDGPGHQWLQDVSGGSYTACGSSGLSGGGSCV